MPLTLLEQKHFDYSLMKAGIRGITNYGLETSIFFHSERAAEEFGNKNKVFFSQDEVRFKSKDAQKYLQDLPEFQHFSPTMQKYFLNELVRIAQRDDHKVSKGIGNEVLKEDFQKKLGASEHRFFRNEQGEIILEVHFKDMAAYQRINKDIIPCCKGRNPSLKTKEGTSTVVLHLNEQEATSFFKHSRIFDSFSQRVLKDTFARFKVFYKDVPLPVVSTPTESHDWKFEAQQVESYSRKACKASLFAAAGSLAGFACGGFVGGVVGGFAGAKLAGVTQKEAVEAVQSYGLRNARVAFLTNQPTVSPVWKAAAKAADAPLLAVVGALGGATLGGVGFGALAGICGATMGGITVADAVDSCKSASISRPECG